MKKLIFLKPHKHEVDQLFPYSYKPWTSGNIDILRGSFFLSFIYFKISFHDYPSLLSNDP